jgi:anti-anti-sigma regulatory factor
MRFFRRGRGPAPTPEADPVVIRPQATSLTGLTAARLVSDVAAAGGQDVVVDLSGIDGWDSEGAATIAELAEGPRPVRLLGFAEATGRMFGVTERPIGPDPADAADSAGAADAAERLTRLRATVVYRPATGADLVRRLEAIVADSGAEITVVVVDLADLSALEPADVDVIAFASSLAAVRHVRLLVVNVPPDDIDGLRGAGLSDQTWVSPPPLD